GRGATEDAPRRARPRRAGLGGARPAGARGARAEPAARGDDPRMGRAGLAGLIAAGLLWACGGHGAEPHGRAEAGAVPFRLTDGRGDFLFEWPDATGEFRTARRVADVPA